MPRVPTTLQNEVTTRESPEGRNWLNLRKIYEQVARVVNYQISFGDGTNSDNMAGVWSNVIAPVANTDFTITHNFGRVAVGYTVWKTSAAGDVYDSPTVNVDPTHTIILRSTAVAGTAIRLFII
jgi:hypothetical protein